MAVGTIKAAIRAWRMASEWIRAVMVVTTADTVHVRAVVQRNIVGMEAASAAVMLRRAITTNIEGMEADMEGTASTINTAVVKVAMADMKAAMEGRTTFNTVGGKLNITEMEADMVATEPDTGRGHGCQADRNVVA